MRLDVVSIFPDYFAPLSLSLIGKARAAGVLELDVHDLRDWTDDRHRTVDDTPYGGGAGMVMTPEPWGRALRGLAGPDSRLIIPTPAGRPFTQRTATRLAREGHLIFACGRYEGIDARVAADAASFVAVEEVSVGDYVLNGGEVAVLAMIEAIGRLLPGVVGNAESLVEESHGAGWGGLVEYPVFTKPARWHDLSVPEVLLSGDHGRIRRWRRDQAIERTAAVRPDLVDALDPALLDTDDLRLLGRLGWEAGPDGLRQVRAVRAAVAD